ncbi:hypothetical protein [Streptomyces hilarionis]|uniref:hypothetical protein n=1 Tax=Streptomyces hilarionis TaxID=2839954 RepID=UPI00211A1B8E|nr:hypothetical protein [Streptomyces hilarionis]MCQ9135874.1 hypothetical protein [Streptomyces hilarionis]
MVQVSMADLAASVGFDTKIPIETLATNESTVITITQTKTSLKWLVTVVTAGPSTGGDWLSTSAPGFVAVSLICLALGHRRVLVVAIMLGLLFQQLRHEFVHQPLNLLRGR